jgi:hypothetical protein
MNLNEGCHWYNLDNNKNTINFNPEKIPLIIFEKIENIINEYIDDPEIETIQLKNEFVNVIKFIQNLNGIKKRNEIFKKLEIIYIDYENQRISKRKFKDEEKQKQLLTVKKKNSDPSIFKQKEKEYYYPDIQIQSNFNLKIEQIINSYDLTISFLPDIINLYPKLCETISNTFKTYNFNSIITRKKIRGKSYNICECIFFDNIKDKLTCIDNIKQILLNFDSFDE